MCHKTKTTKTSLLNTQNYRVCIKDKVKKANERSSAQPYTSV